MGKTAVHIENVTVCFNKTSEQINNIKEYFVKLIKRQLRFQEFLALKNINMDIGQGESWGIIGNNGAGKSTLLKLICGILVPNTGTVSISGSIAPLLELGAGFDPELTARENIFLEGALLGYSRKFMQEHYNEIVEFSELGDFMDIPIKNYSTGMQARIGFAIATLVQSDIVIIDEVLAVGDAAFQQKCEKRIHQMLQGTVTLLFVSHDNNMVERLCTKAVWLRNGEIAMSGNVHDVCDAYRKYCNT